MKVPKRFGARGDPLLSAKGGAVCAAKSPAKAAALRALHASRRGKRVNVSGRERETILAELATALRLPSPRIRSIRVVAEYCRASDRTVRRWLAGEDWPPVTQLRRLEQWLRALEKR